MIAQTAKSQKFHIQLQQMLKNSNVEASYMELTQEEKELLEKLKTQKCVILQEKRSTDYYEGFYDAAQLIMAALKARERG